MLFFDVLHMMPAPDQERLLDSATRSLEADGVLLVREPDAAGGWRFATVRAGNRLKALVTGNWRQRFHFRTADEWTACFERLGFRVERKGADEGTPFANVLFVLSARDRASV
jgi:Methyltransferase domain